MLTAVITAANIANIIPMRRSEIRPVTHRQAGLAMTAFALLLIAFALPQCIVAWLTAPVNLDHTTTVMLDLPRAQKFTRAMEILPQPATAKALTSTYLRTGPLLTTQNALVQNIATRAISLAPGDPWNWYNLAKSLESEIFEPARLVLFDQALSMSMMTGPYTRDLILARLLMVVKYWDKLSQGLRDDWQDQIINLWITSPEDLRASYLAMSPAGRKMVFDAMDQLPGESIKFNQYLDHPETPPAPPEVDENIPENTEK